MFWWERVRSAFSTVASYHSRNMMMLFSFDPSHQPRDYPSWLLWSHIKPTARSQFLSFSNQNPTHSLVVCLFSYIVWIICILFDSLSVSLGGRLQQRFVYHVVSQSSLGKPKTHTENRVNLSSEVCKKLAPIWNSLISSCEKMHAWQRRCAMCFVDKSRMKPPGG